MISNRRLDHQIHIYLLAGSAAAVCFLSAETSATAAQIDAWEIKQQTDHLGPVTVWVSSQGIKFEAKPGGFTVYANKPTWKVIGLNPVENIAFTIPLDEWPHNGLKMFKGQGDMNSVKPTAVMDNTLKRNVSQRELESHGRYFGSNDPAIFRAAEKKQLKSMRLRYAPEIALDEEQKKVVQGLYSLPFAGGFPLELASYTTDGGVNCIYTTKSIARKKVDSSLFKYPTGFKKAPEKIDVYVTKNKKKTFAEFLDAFTDDPDLRKKNAPSK